MSNKLKTFYYSVLSFQALSLCVEWFRMEFYHVNIPHIFLRPNLTEKVFKKIPEHQTNSCKYLFQIVDFFFLSWSFKDRTIIGQNIVLNLNGKRLFREEQHKSFEANGIFQTVSEFQYSPY